MNYNGDNQMQNQQPYMIQRMTGSLNAQVPQPQQQRGMMQNMAPINSQNQQILMQQQYRPQQQIPSGQYGQAGQPNRMGQQLGGGLPSNMIYHGQQQQQQNGMEDASIQQIMVQLPIEIRNQIQLEPDPERRKLMIMNYRKRQMEQQAAMMNQSLHIYSIR